MESMTLTLEELSGADCPLQSSSSEGAPLDEELTIGLRIFLVAEQIRGERIEKDRAVKEMTVVAIATGTAREDNRTGEERG